MKIINPKTPEQRAEQIRLAEQAMKGDYADFSQKALITHKLASAYGWNHDEIWKMCPYPLMKELLKLLDTLEKDQKVFISPVEAAIFKCLLRLYPPKDK